MRDLRTGGVLSVDDDKAIDVRGWNFAPTASLTCVFRYENTNGGVFSTMVERWVPAHFVASDHIRCPIPEHHFADAGVRQHSVHDLSTTNDGAIYRYSNHTFEYHGGCLPNAFAVILGGPMVALVIVLCLCLVCVVVAARRAATRRDARAKLRAAIMEKIGEQRYESGGGVPPGPRRVPARNGRGGRERRHHRPRRLPQPGRDRRGAAGVCRRRRQRRLRKAHRGGGVCPEPTRDAAAPLGVRRRLAPPPPPGAADPPASAPRLSCGGAGPPSYYAPSPGRLPAPGSQRALEITRQESERGRRAAAADAEASASGDNPVLYGNWRAYGVGLDAEDAALIEMRCSPRCGAALSDERLAVGTLIFYLSHAVRLLAASVLWRPTSAATPSVLGSSMPPGVIWSVASASPLKACCSTLATRCSPFPLRIETRVSTVGDVAAHRLLRVLHEDRAAGVGAHLVRHVHRDVEGLGELLDGSAPEALLPLRAEARDAGRAAEAA